LRVGGPSVATAGSEWQTVLLVPLPACNDASMSNGLATTSQAPTEDLVGLVEGVTFHKENGSCVLRLKARGPRNLITIVGDAAMISAVEWIFYELPPQASQAAAPSRRRSNPNRSGVEGTPRRRCEPGSRVAIFR
jgi:hypothetical protein